MSLMPESMSIFLEFEPVVKLVCEALDCKNNLVNAANAASDGMACCNLKQITIKRGGVCKQYKPIENKATPK